MTCKDCVHYEVCVFHTKGNENEKCCHFKPKSRIVELPCEVGQTMYVLDKADVRNPIKKREFDEVAISRTKSLVFAEAEFGMRFAYDFCRFGKTVFLSREEAENALKERERE